MLSEVAFGKRGRKVVASVDVNGVFLRFIAKESIRRMCGLMQYSMYGTRDAAQHWEEERA